MVLGSGTPSMLSYRLQDWLLWFIRVLLASIRARAVPVPIILDPRSRRDANIPKILPVDQRPLPSTDIEMSLPNLQLLCSVTQPINNHDSQHSSLIKLRSWCRFFSPMIALPKLFQKSTFQRLPSTKQKTFHQNTTHRSLQFCPKFLPTPKTLPNGASTLSDYLAPIILTSHTWHWVFLRYWLSSFLFSLGRGRGGILTSSTTSMLPFESIFAAKFR